MLIFKTTTNMKPIIIIKVQFSNEKEIPTIYSDMKTKFPDYDIIVYTGSDNDIKVVYEKDIETIDLKKLAEELMTKWTKISDALPDCDCEIRMYNKTTNVYVNARFDSDLIALIDVESKFQDWYWYKMPEFVE